MPPLLEKILQNPKFKKQDSALIERAYFFAKAAHGGQKRMSGEEYITHPLHAAYFLSELGFDAITVAACLLHDTVEDTSLTAKNIEKEFGKEISFLVDGVTKLAKIEYSEKHGLDQKQNANHISSLKKMFFAMADDIRVILIKLADRYHNMETLKYLPQEDQKRIAKETLEIYAPIAARLGMGYLKGQFEDMAFPYIYPAEYSWLIKQIKTKYADNLNYAERTKPLIKRKLQDAGIEITEMNSRIKHYYSLYQKLLRYDMDFNKIFDLVAMRIILPDIKSCYEALGVIHNFYKPLPGLIKDYISLPKPNGYQSLHTTIFCEKGKIVEIQIRTAEMHEYAENGIAAHWAYSESGKKKPVKTDTKDIQWVTQLKNFLKEIKTGEEFSNLKIDFFKNRIFVFTPKGEVKDLPEGATPVDFAYAIHTDLGHAILGAKANNKMVPLHYELRNGDMVEILKGKNPKPSFDWLKIVKTAEARKKIKSWFRDSPSPQNLQFVELANSAVLSQARPGQALPGIKKPAQRKPISISKNSIRTLSEPLIQGQSGLLYKLAKCCNPTPDKKIRGYMTVNRGVSIHLTSCSNIKSAQETRILSAHWPIEKSEK
ncbi:MAG: hypothetical protein A2746_02040 [Candidatus Yanofskybacteria bacterium RIFCSPHIGHO2_01_FULL_44_22]|uniref:TGS domain-containing protein n=1 Tax=Candidatus Yanofskybacteria bacterium RIFCSPHIGHO2_01_FULL_44_22 TaxID=1802669 RepID=A0A1F8EY70_9BACT|nr:MAG: GTP pyrophosphokinase/guanosine-3',5'-bis (Diphosphate) 3'-pyrophosphohydrolase [Parcubacteria group bacterium GW2011_GWA1_47_9]OGN05817.1 MAG: hypothetical protein A2746_02040 [Candidatus Yanofskybacteria bacterium RIFCSPHIGHO2_01_FULL_44_22]